MERGPFRVGVAVSLLFLIFYLLPQQDWAKLWDSLRSAQYLWLIPAIATYFIGVWFRAWRLHYMMRPIKKVSVPILFPIVCIGYMGNNIYPARMGEVVRAYVIKQKEGVSISASLAIVLIERIFDAVVMMLFIFVNLPELAKKGSVESGIGGTIQEGPVLGAVI